MFSKISRATFWSEGESLQWIPTVEYHRWHNPLKNGSIDRDGKRARFFYGVLDPRFEKVASHECESRCWPVYEKGNRPAIGIYYSRHAARTFLPSSNIPRYTIPDASRRQHLFQASRLWAKIGGNSVDVVPSSYIHVIVDQIRRYLRARKWNSMCERRSPTSLAPRVFFRKAPKRMISRSSERRKFLGREEIFDSR